MFAPVNDVLSKAENIGAITAEDLKRLGMVLPPNLQLATGDVAGVVSALVALLEHGPGLMSAAKTDARAVAQFFHDELTKQAAAAGTDAPTPGIALTQPVTPVAPRPGFTSDPAVTALADSHTALAATVADQHAATTSVLSEIVSKLQGLEHLFTPDTTEVTSPPADTSV